MEFAAVMAFEKNGRGNKTCRVMQHGTMLINMVNLRCQMILAHPGFACAATLCPRLFSGIFHDGGHLIPVCMPRNESVQPAVV